MALIRFTSASIRATIPTAVSRIPNSFRSIMDIVCVGMGCKGRAGEGGGKIEEGKGKNEEGRVSNSFVR